jgi:hypothetical protein
VILLKAYVRRKRFEAKLLAGEVGRMLAGSGPSTGAGRSSASTGSASGGRMHADDVLAMMGISL